MACIACTSRQWRTMTGSPIHSLPRTLHAAAPPVLCTVVALQIVCTGTWAKKGTATLTSLLRRRTTSLRIFVLGDVEGWKNLLGTMQELSQAQKLDMAGVSFEHIDFEQMPEFQRYMCLVICYLSRPCQRP